MAMSGSDEVLNTSVPSPAATDFCLLLAKLPSEGNVLGFHDMTPVSKLSQLASHIWLSDTTVNMMLDIIQQPIWTNLYLSSHHDIVLCCTATKIQSVYDMRNTIEYPSSKDCGELPRLGSDLAGLEGIGKIQFATVCASAISMQWCPPALRELVDDPQKFKFPPKKASMVDLLKKHSHAGTLFKLNLNHLVKVQSPIAKLIVCLESSQSDPSDVHKFLLVITSMLKQLFDDPSHGFTNEEQKQIHVVVNKHFYEIIQDGPADCYSYIAAFFLDPHKSLLIAWPPFLNIVMLHAGYIGCDVL
ncbi:hypothetical protein EDB19DRAFT_1903563 [Suillus lakei]|nr:hypothetical protein EDB19DRAFT_1903563 [Suillus lakei]